MRADLALRPHRLLPRKPVILSDDPEQCEGEESKDLRLPFCSHWARTRGMIHPMHEGSYSTYIVVSRRVPQVSLLRPGMA
jgi:hypothetical protein